MFLNIPASGQPITRYNTFSYSVNEGLLQTTINSLEIDKNNFCWISFPNGIQKFDGHSFTNVSVQPGLPDDKGVFFFRSRNGVLLVGHTKGISRYNIERNSFSQVYQPDIRQNRPVSFIGEDGDVIYFYDENGTITGIHNDTYKIVSVMKTELPLHQTAVVGNDWPKFSDNIIHHKVGIMLNFRLHLFDLKKGKLSAISPEIPKASIFFLRLKTEDEALYFDYINWNALQCWNFKTNKTTSIPLKVKNNHAIGRCKLLRWQNKWLLTLTDRVYETDSASFEFKSEFVNFQNLPISENNSISDIKQDNYGNLYIQTITGGIKKIIHNNYPIKYFGAESGKARNILSVLPDKKNNRILAGADGIYIYDTLQRLIKHIKIFPGSKSSFLVNAIVSSGSNDYYVFANGQEKAWRLDKNLSGLTPVPIVATSSSVVAGTSYFGNIIYNNGKEAIVQTQRTLYRIGNSIKEYPFSTSYVMGGAWYNNTIVSHADDSLIFLDAGSFKEIKKVSFKNTSGVRCFTTDRESKLFIGSNKGIFKTDATGKIIQQWNKTTGLPDECIYAMVFDKDENLWFSTNKGIFRLGKDNALLQLTKDDGLQENEFNTNVLSVAEDGELYFGGVNGVSSFHPSSISSFDNKVNLLFTGIKANNAVIETGAAAWNVQNIKLPYRQNALSFDFVAMGNNNPGQYFYQYKMKGVDKEWVQNNGLQTVRYSLSPGKYTFQVYASRSFNKDAAPMKEINITIRPPFWKAWWFRTGLGLLALALLYYFINQRNKRRYAARLQQLENERQIKQERERISKDLHDSLGAYANAVLYNTELLEKEKTDAKREELIDDLKFASKDIITALRETVWALKKEEYTAEDCLVRIRNFIQPFAKYYSHIQFTVNGEAPAGLKLHYTKALNLVRIVQEAVSNSIKHAHPSAINVSADIQEGKWWLTVTDNGKGFNYTTLKEDEWGNGLTNMEHRAAESGFEIRIESLTQQGTTITITV